MRHDQESEYPMSGRRGPAPTPTLVPIRSAEERQQAEALQRQAIQQQLFAKAVARRGAEQASRPFGYERPKFNTPAYWRDCARGWISDEEQRDDQADYEVRRRRALDSKHNRNPAPHRHDRPAPRKSKQFAKAMATEAARDDRLTPQSKALLQVIVARTGGERSTDTTKATLGIVMNRCPRSIQRYLAELVKFGYLRTQTIKSRLTGFYIGLRIWVMNKTLPYFTERNDWYDAEQWLSFVPGRRNPEETEESLTKDKKLMKNLLRKHKPRWMREFAYAGVRE